VGEKKTDGSSKKLEESNLKQPPNTVLGAGLGRRTMEPQRKMHHKV